MASPPIGTPASARSRRQPASRRRPIPRPWSAVENNCGKLQHRSTADHHVAMTLKGRACIVQARPYLFRSYQSPLYFACTVTTSLSRLTADSVRFCEGGAGGGRRRGGAGAGAGAAAGRRGGPAGG